MDSFKKRSKTHLFRQANTVGSMWYFNYKLVFYPMCVLSVVYICFIYFDCEAHCDWYL